MLRRFITFIVLLAAAVTLRAADPMSTSYSWDDCQGSARPYPVPTVAYDYPDTLTPVMINHVGRHGARFPASTSHCSAVFGALRQAEERAAKKAEEISRAAGKDADALRKAAEARLEEAAEFIVGRVVKH